MSKYAFKNIDWINFLFLSLTPVTAILLTLLWVKNDGFNWGQVIMAIILYFATGISITAGYHRLFAHKAYDANPFVKFFFLVFGAATFQNSALKWGSDHRIHHNKVDTSEDPYNINEGFFYAHIGWVLLKKNSEVHANYARDMLNDKLIMWQHKYYIPIAVLAGFLFPAALGQLLFGSWLGGLALSGFARVVVVHHCTFFINSLCHCVGSTPYTDQNTAKDSWIMALFTFGEGYHNFHHLFQADFRNGIRWYHFDPTKWLILTLNKLGLAFKLKLTAQEKILSAKMQMKIKKFKARMEATEARLAELEELKERVLAAWNRFQEMKTEYKKTKALQMKARMLEARREFDLCVASWNMAFARVTA